MFKIFDLQLPLCVICFALCAAFGGTRLLADEPAETSQWSDGEKLFALELKQLFSDKCNACHADDPDDLQGGFDMRSRASMLRGGDEFGEDVLMLGDGQQSLLHLVTARTQSGFEMPPKESEKLNVEQIAWIRHWIELDAPWPSEAAIKVIRQQYALGEMVKTSGGLSDDWTQRHYESADLWAYRPLKVAQVPDEANPVDWFIDRRIKRAELTAAGEASAHELCRRISFALTGLPPTVSQVQNFRQQYQIDVADAVDDFAEELMATPHFGEHFGRQWLDVVSLR